MTKPSGPPPPRKALLNLGQPIAKPSDPGWYGNGTLWTQLPWDRQFSRAGAAKVGWFRATAGTVQIAAEPLYGGAARFTADVGSAASYGRTGFAPSILEFGRAGCWLVRARLAGRGLTLVVRVPSAPSVSRH